MLYSREIAKTKCLNPVVPLSELWGPTGTEAFLQVGRHYLHSMLTFLLPRAQSQGRASENNDTTLFTVLRVSSSFWMI